MHTNIKTQKNRYKHKKLVNIIKANSKKTKKTFFDPKQTKILRINLKNEPGTKENLIKVLKVTI